MMGEILRASCYSQLPRTAAATGHHLRCDLMQCVCVDFLKVPSLNLGPIQSADLETAKTIKLGRAQTYRKRQSNHIENATQTAR